MELPLFREYRCTSCSKLLLKGCVFQGLVELKCKRCKKIISWGTGEMLPCAVIDTDQDERVVRISGEVDVVLGNGKEYVLGKRLEDILTRISRSVPPKGFAGLQMYMKKDEYDISDNHLVLHDGERRPTRTFLVPRRERGVFAGYRVFLVPGEKRL